VQAHGALAVPLHLRNAPTLLMRKLGYGKDYQYAHDYEGHVVDQQHLPEELRNRRYYTPGESGYEKKLKERLESWAAKKNSKT
jgi:putative ATPase